MRDIDECKRKNSHANVTLRLRRIVRHQIGACSRITHLIVTLSLQEIHSLRKAGVDISKGILPGVEMEGTGARAGGRIVIKLQIRLRVKMEHSPLANKLGRTGVSPCP